MMSARVIEVVAVVGVMMMRTLRMRGTEAEIRARLQSELKDAEGNWKLDTFTPGEGTIKMAVVEKANTAPIAAPTEKAISA